MNIDLSSMSPSSIYHLMTQTIIPRPIAWVLSSNTDQSINLAPFSYFNAVCSDPPLMMLSMGKKPSGDTKDTATNLQLGADCIVHIAHAQQSDDVTNTAASLAYGESEVVLNNIRLSDNEQWPLQRITDCPIAYWCRVHSFQDIGNTPQRLVFVEALEVYIDDAAVTTANNRLQVDALKVKPLARLGASQYADLGEVFSKARPK